MRVWLVSVLGVVVVALGVVWTLQGLGYVGGSAMTGERVWAVIGPAVALVGLLLMVLAARSRRGVPPRPRPDQPTEP
jgi:hypothetical protein